MLEDDYYYNKDAEINKLNRRTRELEHKMKDWEDYSRKQKFLWMTFGILVFFGGMCAEGIVECLL